MSDSSPQESFPCVRTKKVGGPHLVVKAKGQYVGPSVLARQSWSSLPSKNYIRLGSFVHTNQKNVVVLQILFGVVGHGQRKTPSLRQLSAGPGINLGRGGWGCYFGNLGRPSCVCARIVPPAFPGIISFCASLTFGEEDLWIKEA
ncbi:hypothetical protein CEXT_203641 [Caerostris extrusa]|uniref:Uncharacterized protein n=1 Tax=Caerostris extrusa TaxID=172846 RepID=A0AAV4XB42_CAEEX|nr:hypothetical protein CEXT_203641 [Caerostris extrusa]